MTMKDVHQTLNKWMGSRIGWFSRPRDRTHLLQYLPKSQDDLPLRSLKDSYAEAIIPLSSEPKLQNRYVTATGKLRMGRIIEDMDLFSVYVGLRHIKNPLQKKDIPTPYVIVTAAVDDIEYIYEKPDVTSDVKISGKVVSAGNSSMNVAVELAYMQNKQWVKMAKANFMMAARNSNLSGPAYVNKLKPDGPEEEKEMKDALETKRKKIEHDKYSLLVVPPSDEEQKLIHENFVKSVDMQDPTINKRILPSGHVWMEDTRLNTSIFPHPENRNHHNTVFGGYLMRLAMELAWMTAYIHSSQRPSLRYVSNISFRKPVKLNSFLKIMSQVIYTYDKYMQIAVFIELYEMATKQVLTTNSFHFTYEVPEPVAPVMPKTYHEAILWLEGRRHLARFQRRPIC
ncbi:unnamed protein product [Nezara viridula]|uniref:HotDog ACOT-type domain-containing protein n=1 Tax=Nezara viridula TaxID=85310 RepID=A0A9P0MKZ1_NEZVI|nr:unnamed protein product [Nezara viridula]